ncbi:sensor histidine kinase [Streptomyces sp. 4N509B]|uniref:sensor histidine kinase n=1 Tax=Streptomyces sp. 4N509B TaxID=3457413 RepID=UPI003FD5F6EB
MVRAFMAPQDPGSPWVLRRDAVIAAVVGVVCAVEALVAKADGRQLDLTGWLLLAALVAPLVWRNRRPITVLAAHLAFAAPYHGLDYVHVVTMIPSGLALYTVVVTGTLVRSIVLAVGVKFIIALVWLRDAANGAEMLRVSGWFLVAVVLGEAVRWHGQYIAAIRERAERAERTREQEAARRVAEERLRIARDLHDLLAHSITLIGVRASVASHVLIADPGRLDRAALAEALESISDTCRDARAELRTTLQVLRGDEPGSRATGGERERLGDGDRPHAPLPDLSGIPDLIRAAEAAGAKVSLTLDAPGSVPPVAGAAAYRIVQEALTNAVRHAGSDVVVDVVLRRRDAILHLSVTDSGPASLVRRPADRAAGREGADGAEGAERAEGAEPGFGITGMRERARSVGGTLLAGPRQDAPGFAVSAELPVAVAVAAAAPEEKQP